MSRVRWGRSLGALNIKKVLLLLPLRFRLRYVGSINAKEGVAFVGN